MKEKEVLYIVSGRSFHSSNPGRKISEVVSVWQKLGINVKTSFGKDIISRTSNVEYGNQKHYDNNIKNNKYLSFIKHSVSEYKDFSHDRKLYRAIKRNGLNVKLIWERSSRLHWSGLRLAKKLQIPFVLEWKDHLIDYKFSLFKPFAKYIEDVKIKQADYIIVESEVLKTELVKLGVPPRKIHVALNAVNSNEFKKDIAKSEEFKLIHQIPKANTVVGYLGSYAFYHNTELLIHAADVILKKIDNVSFVLVGNGKDYDLCKSIAENYGILNNGLIMINGVPKEDVPGILSSIDISVLPGSTDIICPIKIMEYMASETAIVVPDYSCNREIVTHGQTGRLFEPNDLNDLVMNIEFLIKNKDIVHNLANKARVYVEHELTWEKTWGMVLKNILINENIDS